jgi:hypothetical protein
MSSLAHRHYSISLYQALVLLHNLLSCEDGDNDANRTRDDLFSELNKKQISLDKEVLESCLYCANINNEDRKFWHPEKKDFDLFLRYVVPPKHKFDKIYNVIEHIEDKK